MSWRKAWRGRGERAHALVDAHFARTTSPRQDARLWRHLARCEPCRGRYRARAWLESLEPGDPARVRLGRALFPPAARPRLIWPALALAAGAAAGLALWARPDDGLRGARDGLGGGVESAGDGDGRFTARGGDGTSGPHGPSVAARQQPQLHVFRSGGAAPERAGAVLRVGDGLAFAYVNPPGSGAARLAVFAVDGAGQTSWFWPAWTDGADDPVSVPIEQRAEPVELREVVRHPLRPGALTVYAVFSDAPLPVRKIEAAVRAANGGAPALGGFLWSQRFDVLP